MARTGRYIYTPTKWRIGRRKTLLESIRGWWIRRTQPGPDVFTVTGYYGK